MRIFGWLASWLLTARSRVRNERGDVPGWVMITIMSAVLIIAILGVFEPQLKRALDGILDKVTNAG